MRRGLWLSELDVERNMTRLCEAARRIIAGAAGAKTSWDQRYRKTTYAIESANIAVSEVTARLTKEWRNVGANCTVNSLWVLAWYGEFNKLEMSRRMMAELFAMDLEAEREAFFYVGDSVNDEPMFEFFPYSAGVSTIKKSESQLRNPPRWVTKGPGGTGFVEVANAVLRAR
jgi:3-deoxy-D-manno-octulosonate 8-phosphate phosphatase KdsC-like HAD superfamily phosphatase